jgi:hypothetical protein
MRRCVVHPLVHGDIRNTIGSVTQISAVATQCNINRSCSHGVFQKSRFTALAQANSAPQFLSQATRVHSRTACLWVQMCHNSRCIDVEMLVCRSPTSTYAWISVTHAPLFQYNGCLLILLFRAVTKWIIQFPRSSCRPSMTCGFLIPTSLS